MNEAQLIEQYIAGVLLPEDLLVFEARMILEPGLSDRVCWQKRTHELVREYSRKQVKACIAQVHARLFSEPQFASFRKKIYHIFKF